MGTQTPPRLGIPASGRGTPAVVLNDDPRGDGRPVRDGFVYAYRRPALTADAVLFTIRADRLHVLLVRRANEPSAGAWALPGGYTDMSESLEETVSRELREETGIRDIWMEQLYTFDRPERRDAQGRVVVQGRDPRGRTVSVAFYALVPHAADPQGGDDATDAAWHPVDGLPELAFDHAEVIEYAVWRLRNKIEYSSIGFHFLPDTFTLPQLQRVYEAVLGQPIDRRNFRKKVLQAAVLEPTGSQTRSARGRPATLYRFTRRPFGWRAWR
jgi:8-oxo-dGTP diphosphatase